MTRTQVAFRLDEEKASKFKQKVESEGRSLNVVLESLVDNYLESGLTDVSNDAIALLTDKITQLEKQLTPVSKLLEVTATDKEKLTPVNNEVTTSSRGCFGFAVNTLLTSGNNAQDANSKLTDGSKAEEVTSVNSELASGSSETEGAIAPQDSEEGENASSEVTSGNTKGQEETVSNELTSGNTEKELTSVNSELSEPPPQKCP